MARSIKIPSSRLHKPTNQAIVVLRGKTFYLGRFGSNESRDEYNRIITEWLAASPSTPPPSLAPGTKSDLRISELSLAYWRHVESYYVKDGKQTSQVHIVRLALKPAEMPVHGPELFSLGSSIKAITAPATAESSSAASLAPWRWSISFRASFVNVDLDEPCSPVIFRMGYGPTGHNADVSQAMSNGKSSSRRLRNGFNRSIDPPRAGSGSARRPLGLRYRTSGWATRSHPSALIWTTRHDESPRSR